MIQFLEKWEEEELFKGQSQTTRRLRSALGHREPNADTQLNDKVKGLMGSLFTLYGMIDLCYRYGSDGPLPRIASPGNHNEVRAKNLTSEVTKKLKVSHMSLAGHRD